MDLVNPLRCARSFRCMVKDTGGGQPHNNTKFIKQESAINRKNIIVLVKTDVLAVLNWCGKRNKINCMTTVDSYVTDIDDESYIID